MHKIETKLVLVITKVHLNISFLVQVVEQFCLIIEILVAIQDSWQIGFTIHFLFIVIRFKYNKRNGCHISILVQMKQCQQSATEKCAGRDQEVLFHIHLDANAASQFNRVASYRRIESKYCLSQINQLPLNLHYLNNCNLIRSKYQVLHTQGKLKHRIYLLKLHK